MKLKSVNNFFINKFCLFWGVSPLAYIGIYVSRPPPGTGPHRGKPRWPTSAHSRASPLPSPSEATQDSLAEGASPVSHGKHSGQPALVPLPAQATSLSSALEAVFPSVAAFHSDKGVGTSSKGTLAPVLNGNHRYCHLWDIQLNISRPTRKRYYCFLQAAEHVKRSSRHTENCRLL